MPLIKEMASLLQHMPPENGLDYNKTFRHTAILMKRGKILAAANNRLGNRSEGCGHSDYTLHAEAACIKKVGDIRKLEGATMYVFRVGKNQQLGNSYPCHICQQILNKCMNKYGLRRVFYSVGTVAVADDDIEKIQRSPQERPKHSPKRPQTPD